MFIDLCDYKENIDKDIYEKIRAFSEIFDKNIKYPALFGRVKFKDAEFVRSEIKKITEIVSSKVYELESYLMKFPI